MNVRHLGRNLAGQMSFSRRHWPHGNHRWAFKAANWAGHNIGFIHGNVVLFSQMTNLNAGFEQGFFKRKRAANQKANHISLPIRSGIGNLFSKMAVFIETVTRNIRTDVGVPRDRLGQGCLFDGFQQWTGLRILPNPFTKVMRIHLRQDYQISLCIARCHAGCRKINDARANPLSNLGGRLLDIGLNIKSRHAFHLLDYIMM